MRVFLVFDDNGYENTPYYYISIHKTFRKAKRKIKRLEKINTNKKHCYFIRKDSL